MAWQASIRACQPMHTIWQDAPLVKGIIYAFF